MKTVTTKIVIVFKLIHKLDNYGKQNIEDYIKGPKNCYIPNVFKQISSLRFSIKSQWIDTWENKIT